MTATVGYRRVSTSDQRLDRQDLSAVDKLFEDQASGKDRDRPGLTACLAYVREGDTLRCHSADRLARSLADLIGLVEKLTGRGVRVEFVKGGMVFDRETADPYAVRLMQVMGAFAELERNLIRTRQAEGIAAAKQRGAYRGRQPALTADEVRRPAGATTTASPWPAWCGTSASPTARCRPRSRAPGLRMTALDVRDAAALKAALDAVLPGHWADVITAGETFRLVKVSGGWHLPGDLTVASGDVADGRPTSVVLLGDLFGEDPYPVEGWEA